MKVAVIESGVSGLTSTAHLMKERYSVNVYEQHEKIGGPTSGPKFEELSKLALKIK